MTSNDVVNTLFVTASIVLGYLTILFMVMRLFGKKPEDTDADKIGRVE